MINNPINKFEKICYIAIGCGHDPSKQVLPCLKKYLAEFLEISARVLLFDPRVLEMSCMGPLFPRRSFKVNGYNISSNIEVELHSCEFDYIEWFPNLVSLFYDIKENKGLLIIADFTKSSLLLEMWTNYFSDLDPRLRILIGGPGQTFEEEPWNFKVSLEMEPVKIIPFSITSLASAIIEREEEKVKYLTNGLFDIIAATKTKNLLSLRRIYLLMMRWSEERVQDLPEEVRKEYTQLSQTLGAEAANQLWESYCSNIEHVLGLCRKLMFLTGSSLSHDKLQFNMGRLCELLKTLYKNLGKINYGESDLYKLFGNVQGLFDGCIEEVKNHIDAITKEEVGGPPTKQLKIE